MAKLSDIDKNFLVETTIDRDDIVFYNVCDEPFKVYGLLKPDKECDHFRRMPRDVADSVGYWVGVLSANTAGGRVRFRTDSSYIAINAAMHGVQLSQTFPHTGAAGFDLYEIIDGEEHFIKQYMPPYEITDGYESLIDFSGFNDFKERKEREFSIGFPLYSGVKKLYIGIEKSAVLKPAVGYKTPGRIVYYGSSITQGACASRPGNTYESMIARRLNCDFLNLGFSGAAGAEREMANYIAGLDMRAFVFDYDHNAPDLIFLKKTHKPFFDVVRKANPTIPIVIVTRPEVQKRDVVDERFDIIEKTYKTAIKNGDKNVYLIDGREIMKGIAEDSGTVDGVHPTDLGFYCMAEKIGDVLERVL